MNAWVRIIPTIMYSDHRDICGPRVQTKYEASLRLLVYPSEQTARDSAEKYGGLVVEMNVRELRGTFYADMVGEELTDPSHADVQAIADKEPFIYIVVPHKRVSTPDDGEDEPSEEIQFNNKTDEHWALDVVADISGFPRTCPACGGTDFSVSYSGRGRDFSCACGKKATLEELWAEEKP